MRESAGNFRVKMYGYNYDELAYWGEKLKEKIADSPTYQGSDYQLRILVVQG